MPSSNDRRRGVWSHWVPLVVTVTIASAGLVAWALSQRKDDDHAAVQEHEQHLDYENADYGDNPAYVTTRPPRAVSARRRCLWRTCRPQRLKLGCQGVWRLATHP
ncbi:hypothetical protein NQ176_g5777 [Zarea fungicola]|uniref:Uncharacterized protein n=1 Tax=Zarea fungicola TaxID=93591 RepID=A0ACC1N6T8_9HYPO|nr:hypothetical protein NQ176_g5777 [Lecanicillium fungicola]